MRATKPSASVERLERARKFVRDLRLDPKVTLAVAAEFDAVAQEAQRERRTLMDERDVAREKHQAVCRERDQALSRVAAMSRLNPGASGTKTAASVYYERAEAADATNARLVALLERARGEMGRLCGRVESPAFASDEGYEIWRDGCKVLAAIEAELGAGDDKAGKTPGAEPVVKPPVPTYSDLVAMLSGHGLHPDSDADLLRLAEIAVQEGLRAAEREPAPHSVDAARALDRWRREGG